MCHTSIRCAGGSIELQQIQQISLRLISIVNCYQEIMLRFTLKQYYNIKAILLGVEVPYAQHFEANCIFHKQ